uniref:CHK kinase-like domain-containing protein n=1 Tax=Homalodisca liturata TaxID=320908 RepID=A0A1B6HMU5_9HEMI
MVDAVPHWIDKSFLTLCLTGGLNDETSDIQVSSFEVSSLLPPGNNYSSYLLRVKVIFNRAGITSNQSLIIKYLTGNDEITKLFDKLFDTEPSFYNQYLPEALKVSDSLPVPRSFYSPISNIIILEDLSAEGYKMGDRCKMLDFDHCKHFFIASAIFHATSVAVYKKHPDIVTSIAVDPVFSKDLAESCVKIHKGLMIQGLLCMADRLERVQKYQAYAEVVRNCTSDIWDRVVNLHQQNYKLNVLQQADPWTPNMMFKYDEAGKVTAIKLLDFQATRYSSPLCSLVFFIWTSASHEVREQRLEELYHIYCDVLNAKLEELDCSDRLSYEEFQDGIKTLSPAILAIAAYFFPSITSPRVTEIGKTINTICEGTSNPYDDYYDAEFCEKNFVRLVDQLAAQGVFDALQIKG